MTGLNSLRSKPGTRDQATVHIAAPGANGTIGTSSSNCSSSAGASTTSDSAPGRTFTSNASGYAANPFFVWKMVLIVLAGVNMGIFHFFTWKSVHNWDVDCAVPLAGKIAGALSLVFWIVVVTCGRWIGFTLGWFQF